MNMSGWKFTTTSSNKLKTEIKYLSGLAVNDPKNSLKTNYEKIVDDIACTVGFYNDQPTTMCFVYDRPLYNGMLRILSRFYYYGGLDITHYPNRNMVRPSTKAMIDSQIDFCKKVGCDDIFFSKERNQHVVKRFCKAINFRTDEYKYKVTKDDYQYVGWIGELCLQRQ